MRFPTPPSNNWDDLKGQMDKYRTAEELWHSLFDVGLNWAQELHVADASAFAHEFARGVVLAGSVDADQRALLLNAFPIWGFLFTSGELAEYHYRNFADPIMTAMEKEFEPQGRSAEDTALLQDELMSLLLFFLDPEFRHLYIDVCAALLNVPELVEATAAALAEFGIQDRDFSHVVDLVDAFSDRTYAVA